MVSFFTVLSIILILYSIIVLFLLFGSKIKVTEKQRFWIMLVYSIYFIVWGIMQIYIGIQREQIYLMVLGFFFGASGTGHLVILIKNARKRGCRYP